MSSVLTTETTSVRSRVRRTSTVSGSTPIKKRSSIRKTKADGTEASESDASMISASEVEDDAENKLREARARAESISKQIEDIKRGSPSGPLTPLIFVDLLFFAPFRKNIIVPLLITLLALLLFWAARGLAARNTASPILNANADLAKEVQRMFEDKLNSVTPDLSNKLKEKLEKDILAELDRRLSEARKKDEEKQKAAQSDLSSKLSSVAAKETVEELKKEIKNLQSQVTSADQKAQLADILKRLTALESAPKSVGEAATRDQVTKAVAAELATLEKKILKDIDAKVADGGKSFATKDEVKKSFEDLSARLQKLSADAKEVPKHEHPVDEQKVRNIVKSLMGEITPPPASAALGAADKQALEAQIMSAVELRLRNALADIQHQQQQNQNQQGQKFNIEDQRTVISAWIADALKSHTHSAASPSPSSSSTPSSSAGGLTEERVRAIVADALEVFAADRIALADYASHSGGASVVVWRSSQTYKPAGGVLGFLSKANSPSVLLETSLEPSKCWAFQGSKGFVTIKLVEPVQIGAITVDHISDRVAYSVASAPKDFEVFGLTHDEEEKEKAVSLGKFRYSLDAHKATQTFEVNQAAKGATQKFSHVLVDFSSNHGNPDYTCVYRIRVHSAAQINSKVAK